jgi:pilus assembly protein Flp/PilA
VQVFRVLFRSVRTFLTDDTAQGLVEYALIVALVSIVAIAALRVLGEKASNTLSNAAGKLS